MFKHISTKTYGHEVGLSCAFRQWRAESHCNLIHGYALSIRLEFEATELDERNWVVDFGGLKSLKKEIEDTFDHTLVIAADDPSKDMLYGLEELGLARIIEIENVGCEAFAEHVFMMAEAWLANRGYDKRVKVRLVEVKEHGANSAMYVRG